jgi:hypothetical protein
MSVLLLTPCGNDVNSHNVRVIRKLHDGTTEEAGVGVRYLRHLRHFHCLCIVNGPCILMSQAPAVRIAGLNGHRLEMTLICTNNVCRASF